MAGKWPQVEFGALLQNGTRNGVYKGKQFHGSGAKIVNMGELFANPRLRDVPMKRVRLTEAELDRSSIKVADLLFARRSLIAEGAGKCSIVMEVNEPTTFESSIIRARPDQQRAISLFLYYVFSSSIGQNLLGTILRQVAVSGITGTDLVKLKVPLPPIEEQQAIACILGALDDKIELNRRMNRTLEEMARAIFKSWFVDFDPVRAKAAGKQPAGLNPEIAFLFSNTFENSELGEIPKCWGVRPIGDVVRVLGGGTPSTKESVYWQCGSHPFCTPKDMASLTAPVLLRTERLLSDEGLARGSSGQLPVGTVLLSSRAPIGYLAIADIPVSINQGIIAMVCDGVLPNLYVLHWTSANMDRVIANANGSTFLEISKRNFRSIAAVIPPQDVLRQFMNIVEPLKQRVVSSLGQIQNLTAIRDALLPKLLSGELVVAEAERIIARCI